MRWFSLPLFFAVILATGCANSRDAALPLASLPEPRAPLVLPGVDSIYAAEAERLATVALVDNRQREAARRAVEGGVKLLDMADSLSARFAAAPRAGTGPVDADAVNQATELFNEGARVLRSSEDAPGLMQLIEAESAFRRALVANPHDVEAHYWLSRVYEMQYERLGQSGAVNDAIEVLQRLVEMHPHVHDYAALLAEATQASGAHEAGGGLWHRAATLVLDDAALDPSGEAVPDSALAFQYLASASTAFVDGDAGDMALAALTEARRYATSEADRAWVAAERDWISWDVTLATRKAFDGLIVQASTDPAGAVGGLQALMGRVTHPAARHDVQHQLALTLHAMGRHADAVTQMRALWEALQAAPDALLEQVRTDYGIMTYNLAVARREEGELRSAVAYLLQSEATKWRGSARASLTLAAMLRNEPRAALQAAQRAEEGWESLEPEEQDTLLQLLIETLRRLDEREEAARYVQRYRALRSER